MQKCKILIADDKSAIRLTLKTMLKFHFSDIIEAENGEEILLLLEKYDDISIILTDIEMPKLDGFETTEYIRTDFLYPKNAVPIIAVSSHTDNEYLAKCKKYGFNDVLIKPFTAADLLNMVNKYLKK